MTQAPVTVQPARSSPGTLAFTGPGALAPTTSLRGSQMLAATIQDNPEFGYYYSYLPTAEAQKRSLNVIADDGTEYLFTFMDAMLEALGLIRPDPQSRLNFYRTEKTPAMWAEQQAKYPADYTEDLADYDRLLVRVEQGMLV